MKRVLAWKVVRGGGVAAVAWLSSLPAGCSQVVSSGSYVVEECDTNADCVAAHQAPAWVCRPSDHTCQGLITDDCPTVLGADHLTEEGSVVWGALFALNGPNSGIGLPELDAVKMAYQDFSVAANGLPPLSGSSTRRQITVLVCDDSAANDVALRSVTHMVEDVGIKAIVGPTFSGPTSNFMTLETLPKDVLVVASGTTSPSFTTLPKDGLFFRTCESTSLEVPPLVALASDVESKVSGQLPRGTALKLALVYKGDAYGAGTAQALLPTLSVNGTLATDASNDANFLQADYGNPSDPTTDPLKYSATVAQIIAQQPSIVMAIGANEVFGNIMAPVEQQWPAGVNRPFWLFSHAAVTPALTLQLQQTDPTGSLRKRILGVEYGSRTPTYSQFRSNFIAQQFGDGASPDQVDIATTYDAFYSLAYAATSIGSQPLTGSNVGAGFANLVPPGQTTIHVGPEDLNQALSLLAQGQTIDMVGVSGPLDFNLTTGDVAQENQVVCVPLDPSTNQPTLAVFSGYGFDLSNNRSGSIDSVTATCGVTFTLTP